MFDVFWHKFLNRPYNLYVSKSGRENGPIVVLLHGIAASGEDWEKVLPYLESRYKCLTIDLLGFGESPKPEWAAYTMDDHMRSLYKTMNKLKSVILVTEKFSMCMYYEYGNCFPSKRAERTGPFKMETMAYLCEHFRLNFEHTQF